jgi:hypothetical protein
LQTVGYFLLIAAIAVHIGFWQRARALHGFWGHATEAGYWMQMIDVLSLLAFVAFLFGRGWNRALGFCLAFGSFLLCCGYGAGL